MNVPVQEEQLLEWIHRIQGKTVVIAGLHGAAHGVGIETAHLCASKGAKIVLGDVDAHALASIVEAVHHAGGHAVHKVTDVRYPEQVEELFKFAVHTFGQVDVVINVAGLGGDDSVPLSAHQLDKLNDPTIIGVHHVTSIGLHFLEMNAHSDLKSMVMVNTPGVNNARLRVAPVVRALVPQYEDKGIKLGSVFPWFGDLANFPQNVKDVIGPQTRPPLNRVALAALYIATDPENNGCQLILTDHAATDMVEYGAMEKEKAAFMAEMQEATAEANDDPSAEKPVSGFAKFLQPGANPDDAPTFVVPPTWAKFMQGGMDGGKASGAAAVTSARVGITGRSNERGSAFDMGPISKDLAAARDTRQSERGDRQGDRGCPVSPEARNAYYKANPEARQVEGCPISPAAREAYAKGDKSLVKGELGNGAFSEELTRDFADIKREIADAKGASGEIDGGKKGSKRGGGFSADIAFEMADIRAEIAGAKGEMGDMKAEMGMEGISGEISEALDDTPAGSSKPKKKRSGGGMGGGAGFSREDFIKEYEDIKKEIDLAKAEMEADAAAEAAGEAAPNSESHVESETPAAKAGIPKAPSSGRGKPESAGSPAAGPKAKGPPGFGGGGDGKPSFGKPAGWGGDKSDGEKPSFGPKKDGEKSSRDPRTKKDGAEGGKPGFGGRGGKDGAKPSFGAPGGKDGAKPSFGPKGGKDGAEGGKPGFGGRGGKDGAKPSFGAPGGKDGAKPNYDPRSKKDGAAEGGKPGFGGGMPSFGAGKNWGKPEMPELPPKLAAKL